jgi:hypothetical protein
VAIIALAHVNEKTGETDAKCKITKLLVDGSQFKQIPRFSGMFLASLLAFNACVRVYRSHAIIY